MNKPNATIGETKIDIEIARTVEDREKGLSGRSSLDANSGMLFTFEEEDRHGFWMKDTSFDLDFIWIRNGKVTEITVDVKPNPTVSTENLVVYKPKDPIDSMIEVNAGFASRNGIKVGDTVKIDE